VEYEKQTKFFEYLKNFYPEIEDLLKINPDFVQKWEYLVSDMNTHHQHLKHYTKAFLYELIKEINKLNYKNNYYNKIINLFNKIESF
jgi:polysaccharide pyruvyl transferase WcaK-like protein